MPRGQFSLLDVAVRFTTGVATGAKHALKDAEEHIATMESEEDERMSFADDKGRKLATAVKDQLEKLMLLLFSLFVQIFKRLLLFEHLE